MRPVTCVFDIFAKQLGALALAFLKSVQNELRRIQAPDEIFAFLKKLFVFGRLFWVLLVFWPPFVMFVSVISEVRSKWPVMIGQA